jgi:diadenosine tetraphosphate (Ap4A) HIT family hydrolase
LTFVLDARLARDTLAVGDLPLNRVLLMNDARWPWLILVPRRLGLVELTDLEPSEQTQLMGDAARAALFLKGHFRAEKINVAALGNIVRQLHLHIVARTVGDPAWPGPVWGHGTAILYESRAAQIWVTAARRALSIEPVGEAPSARCATGPKSS